MHDFMEITILILNLNHSVLPTTSVFHYTFYWEMNFRAFPY